MLIQEESTGKHLGVARLDVTPSAAEAVLAKSTHIINGYPVSLDFMHACSAWCGQSFWPSLFIVVHITCILNMLITSGLSALVG